MEIQGLINAYRAKSDDELLQLASDPEHLTSDARLALKSELSRRNIDLVEHLTVAVAGRDRKYIDEMSVPEKRLEHQPHAAHEFVAEALRTYQRHFWLFFKITAPAVIIGTIAIIAGRNESREIVRHYPGGYQSILHSSAILWIWVAASAGYLISSMAFAFSFGAASVAIRDIESGTVPSVAGCFGAVRERLGPFLRVSVLLLFLSVAAVALGGLLFVVALSALRHAHFSLGRLSVWLMSFAFPALALLVVSRFALAIPAVVLDGYGVAPSMFRSDELTEGKWLTLAAILSKSLVGGYLAAMFPFWLAYWLIPPSVSLRSWFPWLLTVASIIGVTVVEPTMFVGFGLLYLRTSGVALQAMPSSRSVVAEKSFFTN